MGCGHSKYGIFNGKRCPQSQAEFDFNKSHHKLAPLPCPPEADEDPGKCPDCVAKDAAAQRRRATASNR